MNNRFCIRQNFFGRFTAVLAMVLAVVLFSGCQQKPGAAKAAKPAKFESIRAMVLAGRYDTAITSLESYIAADGQHASRAGLFLFKSHFAKGDFDQAKKWCQWTIDNHPKSLEARKCEFKLGLVLLAQDKNKAALKQFEAVAASADNPLRPEATFFSNYLKQKLPAKPLEGEESQ